MKSTKADEDGQEKHADEGCVESDEEDLVGQQKGGQVVPVGPKVAVGPLGGPGLG